jgi:hypothetical protein
MNRRQSNGLFGCVQLSPPGRKAKPAGNAEL